MERWTFVSPSCHFLSGCVSSRLSLVIWCLLMSPAAIWCLFCVSSGLYELSSSHFVSHSRVVRPFGLFVLESVWCCSLAADHQHRKKSSLQSDVCVLKSRHLIGAFADLSRHGPPRCWAPSRDLLPPGCFSGWGGLWCFYGVRAQLTIS